MKHLVCLSRSFFVAILIGSATAVSCSKGELVLDDNVTASGSVSPQEEKLETGQNLEIAGLERSVEYEHRLYRAESKYKTAYRHLRQQQSECSWTNYVLAAEAIVDANYGRNYFVTASGSVAKKIEHCKGECRGSTHINTINDYSQTWDSQKYGFTTKVATTGKTNHTGAIKRMLAHLSEEKTPLIYITSENNIGHYIIIWSIDWRGSIENSTVWYTNTLEGSRDEMKSTENSSQFDFKPINCGTLMRKNIMNNHNMLLFYTN